LEEYYSIAGRNDAPGKERPSQSGCAAMIFFLPEIGPVAPFDVPAKRL
jgi:hypothetical protein